MYICREPHEQQLELFERSMLFADKLDRTNLDKLGIQYKVPPGNGSFTHRYYQHQILGKELRKSDTGGIEYSLGSKRVDVGIIRGNEKRAYEVVMEGTLQKEVENLRKDLTDGWDIVIFCVVSNEITSRLLSLIHETDCVEIRLLQEFNGN